MDLKKFKADHRAIVVRLTELRRLSESDVVENANRIADAIALMSLAIRLHLTAEEAILYPAMAKSADFETVRVGRRFRVEIRGIAADYAKFARKWAATQRVIADPAGFRDDARRVLGTIHRRIEHENQELYPLAENA
jgi:hemerythrin-like domain-containing protein